MKHCYRACAEIQLDALEHNIREIRKIIGPDKKLMCVIKTDAYGHGAVPMAKYLLEYGADAFAVATLGEGIELRRHGITQPILVLGYIAKELYPEMIEYDIMPAVFTYHMAKDVDAAANKLHKVAKIHIKLDTGMSRIGFKIEPQTIQSIVMTAMLCKNISIDGIFTHFSCADCEDPETTARQYRKFYDFVNEIEAQGVHIPVKHCSNSAAIARFPEIAENMDMVRAGIIIYGLYPSEEITRGMIDLKPVMKLKSHVVYVKEVEAGTPVSYGGTFVCGRRTKIATVSIGYGDGYPRAMSNKGRVLIGTESFPIIGRVCMDQLMVDVTDAKEDIRQGDEVVLVGSQGHSVITVEEVADQSASFNYEFVCGINRRVSRLYTYGGKPVEKVNYLEY